MTDRLHSWCGLLLTVWISAGGGASASAQSTTFGAVDVVCPAERCEDPGFVARLETVTGVRRGMPYDAAALATAVDNLMQTHWLSACEVDESAAPDGAVDVRFECEMQWVIRDVRIHAGVALGSEIRRRIFMRSGQPWEPDQIDRQLEEIVAYYEDRGFFGTRVDLEVYEDPAAYAVDLVFEVDRSGRLTANRLYVRGHEAMSYGQVRDIVFGEFNFIRTFTVDRFERAQEAVIERYREQGYLQARVSFDDYRTRADETVDLFLEVREGPRWEIDFQIESGGRPRPRFSQAELREALPFMRSGFVDSAEVALGAQRIQSLYETVGHFFADVAVTDRSTARGDRRIVIRVEEGNRSEIREIRFVGVQAIGAAELRATMRTKEYDLIAAGGFLQRSQLSQDIAAIEALYRERGYLQATVHRVVLVSEDEDRDLYVTLHVDEGPRTRLRRIRVESDAGAELPRLAREVRRRWAAAAAADGPRPLDLRRLPDDQAYLLAAQYREGRRYATVDVSCLAHVRDDGVETLREVPCRAASLGEERRLDIGADASTACTRTRANGRTIEECRLVAPVPGSEGTEGLAGGEVTLLYIVRPDRPLVFGEMFVRGNFSTRRRVVGRAMPFEPGEAFDYQLLLEGQSNLRALDLFDAVRVAPFGATADPEGGDAAHVSVNLEEAPSLFFEHGVSLEARATQADGLLLILSNEPLLRTLNLGGRAKELVFIGSFDFDVLDPQRVSDREFRASAAVAYRDPRFYLSRRMRDPWELQAAVGYVYDLLAVAPAPLTREFAFRLSAVEEIDAVERRASSDARARLLVEVGLGLQVTETLDQSDPVVEVDEFEPAVIVSVTPRLILDRLDNPLNPSRGTFSELEVAIADDFIGVLDSERFTKFTFRTSGFIPLGESGFVLGMNGRAGVAIGGILGGGGARGTFALPLSERYSLGGVTTLRGFAEGGVASTATDEFGGDVLVNGNVELRYPFLQRINLQGAVFVDSGQLARDPRDLRADGFRTTTGLGLRWLIADLIPLVVDYGAVLGRRPGEGFGRLHLNVGYTF